MRALLAGMVLEVMPSAGVRTVVVTGCHYDGPR